ncbi:hypothetical protein HOS83_gp10 [Shigella phage SFN6B]|uniref:Uncharacterized protein n=1 Tax=Shigella phage SFN6B TaxID=1785176 RepID=A0A2P0XMZ1_9CAUD|nr:hypothetical protein HOS83_gp10 [Shigella phage SFN6B]AVD98965.1 hypothetical protein [Shigella phage SFN6B]
MSKFKVGDKVVRKSPDDSSSFKKHQGDFDYYTVTDMSPSGHWLQLDNFTIDDDYYPWCATNFELYQELDDELPPAPTSVLYYHSTADAYNLQHMIVQPHWELEGHLSIAIVKSGKKFDPLAYGDALSLNLEPDAALQLAHDLCRMAMDIKRKEKAQ